MHKIGANLLRSVKSTVPGDSPSRLLMKLKANMMIVMKTPEGFKTGAERL